MSAVKKCVIPLWILGSALLISQIPADFVPGPGFQPFACGLLVCYSLPFFALMAIRIPESRSPQRYILLALFALVLATNIFIPLRPYLPGYHPKALEELGYLFSPLFEVPVIAFCYLAVAITTQLLRKDPKRLP